ncbi:MAG: helix-turn-helix transcriptional regulator [Deltaproteobacteria bacterium]|nr:helix-turn-helix transcriptional regulator [Deltaproteobacteria bacterium]
MQLQDGCDIFTLQAQFYKLFANSLRLQIVWELGDGEMTVTELSDHLEVTVSNVSQHLRVMRALGVVRARRDGQRQFYRITNPRFLEGVRVMQQGILEINQERGSNGGFTP